MAEETKGAMPGDQGNATAQPAEGENPATAGQGETKVTSGSAEQGPGKVNPSAPGETGTTVKERAKE